MALCEDVLLQVNDTTSVSLSVKKFTSLIEDTNFLPEHVNLMNEAIFNDMNSR